MALEAQDDPLIGTVLEGRFQIEGLVGEGGMGRVYVAEELRLKRRCAVKVLLPEMSQDNDCVERFMREAQSIAQIHHENVVDIYHLGDAASGHVFFAMELLSGEDLETRLFDRERRPVTWQQVCLWMAQAAGAVAAVHAAGMIHRDLKPSNLFLARRRDGRDQIKLLDFGIAKATNRAALTNVGAAIGTPFYMSPEQILAQPLDPRTDIYSFGVLFFEALTGRRPFVGEAIQVAMQHCNIPAPRMADVNPSAEIPEELEELVTRMLAKEADERPQTMEEVEAYLHELVPVTTPNTNSGLIPRPVTASIPVTRTAARPQSMPAVAAGARTRVEGATPPANTVEISVETVDARPSRRLFPAVIAVVFVLVGALGATYVLTRTDDPGDTPPPIVAHDADTPTAAPTPPSTPTTGADPAPDDPPIVAATTGATPEPVDPPPDPPPDKPEDTKVRKPGDRDKTADPSRQIRKGATACRKKHHATRGPKITIDYAIGSDGAVTRAVPSTQSDLGKCLAEVVKRTKFPPELKLGLKMDL